MSPPGLEIHPALQTSRQRSRATSLWHSASVWAQRNHAPQKTQGLKAKSYCWELTSGQKSCLDVEYAYGFEPTYPAWSHIFCYQHIAMHQTSASWWLFPLASPRIAGSLPCALRSPRSCQSEMTGDFKNMVHILHIVHTLHIVHIVPWA